ncbi:AMP-binding protein [Streptomyces sp. NPDC004237]|uniref:AMP-binding protein n=1 Tax=Streptomyces sp. NPDC004237 TaxID=3154455 RepID=UPI0033B17A4B
MTGPRPSVAVGPGRPVPAGATAHEAVLRQAARSPHATALRGPGGARLTYAGLVARARAVRDLLVEAGVPARGFVPVLARAGADSAVAALGVLLAGAAYAAVDPDWPVRRLRGVIEDLGARVVLDAAGASATLQAALPSGVRTVPLPGPGAVRPAAAETGRPAVGADDPACVFFTSGSTGRPKGVVLPHRAFVRTFVDGGYAAFGPGTVMPLLAAPYWDAGALEVFGPLMNGGTCVTPDETPITPDGLRSLVTGQGVDTLWLTSSLLNLIVDEDPGAFTGIRHLLCGGERLSPPHLAALLDHHPGLRVTNGYGPVESMVFVSTHDVRRADTADPDGIPVGRPVRGTVLAVLDPETLRPAARGTEGELWVAGDGLALGYLHRPEENARRFADVSLPSHGTLRAYATGDRVRMDAGDRLSYVGRADRQFKIRGYRVEPGEVERRIAALPGIRHAFLVPLRDPHAAVTGTVCAYTTDNTAPLPEPTLRDTAAATLPSYLRPDHYLHLRSVPLGPTGKADLRAVEAWVRERRGAGGAGGEVLRVGGPTGAAKGGDALGAGDGSGDRVGSAGASAAPGTEVVAVAGGALGIGAGAASAPAAQAKGVAGPADGPALPGTGVVGSPGGSAGPGAGRVGAGGGGLGVGDRVGPVGVSAVPAAAVPGTPDAAPALCHAREILAAPGLRADSDLLTSGASSLHVLRIAARFSRLLGVRLSARDVYENPSVAALEKLAAARGAEEPAGDSGPGDPDGLSPGERRFWLASRLAPGAPGHVAVSRIEADGPLDPERLRQALAAVAAVHPALRTTFPREGGRPRRRVVEAPAPPPLLIRTAAPGDHLPRPAADGERAPAVGLAEQALTRELTARVRDLEGGPLFAAGVVEAADGRRVLLLAVHHIVYDGRSEEILVADLAAAYAGRPPAPAPAPPTAVPRAGAGAAREFWRGRLAGLAAPRWPGGAAPGLREVWTRPVVAHPVDLGARDTARLREFAVRERYPVLVPLLAAWWRALAKVTGQDDLAVGTVVEDRPDGHDRTVGYFANGLPVRIAADPALDGPALLGLVRERLLEVFAHTALGTDEVAACAPRPAPGRAPLYQNLLALQRVAAPAEADGVRFTPLPAPALGCQTELTCELWDDGRSFAGAVTAPEGLLGPAALAETADLFTTVLADLTGRTELLGDPS